MKLAVTLSLVVVVCVFMGSCNKGPTGGIPFYLKMDTAVIIAPAGISASSNTQSIQDVWVNEGPTNLGAYELPCNFPVLDHDSVNFVINAGVWQSAQSTNPVIYPFLKPDVFTLYAQSGNKYSHVPTFSYIAAAKFVFNEDFESGSEYNTSMLLAHDSVKYGTACGKMTVGPTDSNVVACQTYAHGVQGPYVLTPGEEIWLEFDYKCQVPFWSGIIAHFSSGATDTIQVLFLLPNETWTKQYIKLSETVGQEGASTYNLYFQALNPSGFIGGSVYLDNIRLVHGAI